MKSYAHKILKQGYYKELGEIWHEAEKFNMVGEHITIIKFDGIH